MLLKIHPDRHFGHRTPCAASAEPDDRNRSIFDLDQSYIPALILQDAARLFERSGDPVEQVSLAVDVGERDRAIPASCVVIGHARSVQRNCRALARGVVRYAPSSSTEGSTRMTLVTNVRPAANVLPVSTTTPQAPAWGNPAAAAALRTTVQMLRSVEDGVVQSYSNLDQARAYAADLSSAGDILAVASTALSTDNNVENDQFLPLISKATGGVTVASTRLLSRELAATWPTERSEILSTIRMARMLGENVARSLDPAADIPNR